MTQLNDTPATTAAEVEVPPVQPADILAYLARSVARDLTQLTLATADGVPELIAAAAEDAARGVDAFMATLMEAEGLTIEQAQTRAAGLIAEQGEVETRGTRLGELMDELGLRAAP
ncbi:hypothetical protein FXF51_01590 [Nonomuraea sp. PA05]|uniref:hypothetical protein n=1 Tax=Nonomuraea sp. PA05 TaxID=2604466 RepID=UPI0011DAE617|nr:hypothetical protein [Nonomuraea sp. PA05]TYB71154.1 hypothetical protein FXF51_01590 [Nonomuraea sp. PA05]